MLEWDEINDPTSGEPIMAATTFDGIEGAVFLLTTPTRWRIYRGYETLEESTAENVEAAKAAIADWFREHTEE
jgi:hypothetical protein